MEEVFGVHSRERSIYLSKIGSMVVVSWLKTRWLDGRVRARVDVCTYVESSRGRW